MKKHVVDQFEFNILLICFDEDLVAYEKQYIQKYNTRVPNGYNILLGGQLGDVHVGFKHSPETIEKIKEKRRQFIEKNPTHFETYHEKHKKSLEKADISSAMKNSVKFQKSVEERRKNMQIWRGGPFYQKKQNRKFVIV